MVKFTKLLIAMVTLMLCSCNEVETLSVISDSSFPKIVDGRLKFSSIDDFSSFMKGISSKNIDELEEMSQAHHFTSHLISPNAENKILRNIRLSSELEQLADAPISDAYLSSVINQEKELLIGDDIIYRAGNDFSFFYESGYQHELEAFYQNLSQGAVNQGFSTPVLYSDHLIVFRTGMGYPEPYLPGGRMQARLGQDIKSVSTNWINERREYGEVWQGNWLLYSSAGVKTEKQKIACTLFRTICWWATVDADEISVSAQANITEKFANGPSFQRTVNIPNSETTRFNTGRAIARFDWGTATLGYGWSNSTQFRLTFNNFKLKIITVNGNSGPGVNNLAPTITINSAWSTHIVREGSRIINLTLNW
jgi:hypothetical protein